MRCLYVTSDIRFPLSHGGELRRWHVMQGLRLAAEVDALVFRRQDMPVCREAFAGCQRIIEVSSKHLHFSERQQKLYNSTIGRGLLTLLTPRPYQFLGDSPGELRKLVLREIAKSNYDLVWFNTARTAMAVGHLPGVPTVLDGDDFEYVREATILHATPWYGAKACNYLNIAKLWWWERSWARRHRMVVRCSAEDRDRHPAANVAVVPNGSVIPMHCERAPEPRLLFVGLLSYAPNDHAMDWFLNKVWPLVRREVPDAACDVIGKDPSAGVMQHHGQSGVEVHGFVRDLAPFYRRAAASIAPLHSGSGTRLKILESLAYAVPVVSTHLGAFGIDAYEAQGVHRGDTAEEFAAHCVAHLRLRPALQENARAGRELVQRSFDWSAIHRQIADLAMQAAGENQPTLQAVSNEQAA